MYLAMSCFSLFYELLEVACNLQKHAAHVKQGWWDAELEKGFLLNDP